MPTQLNESVILAAIEGFESQKNRIDQQIAELRALLPGGSSDGAGASEGPQRKRHFSPEAIKRMRAAQQKRWAKVRGEQPAAATVETAKPKKRRLSAAGRKAISEATKKRWALKRAEAAKAATKKAAPARKRAAVKKVAKRAAAKKAAPAPAPATNQAAG